MSAVPGQMMAQSTAGIPVFQCKQMDISTVLTIALQVSKLSPRSRLKISVLPVHPAEWEELKNKGGPFPETIQCRIHFSMDGGGNFGLQIIWDFLFLLPRSILRTLTFSTELQ